MQEVEVRWENFGRKPNLSNVLQIYHMYNTKFMVRDSSLFKILNITHINHLKRAHRVNACSIR